MILACIIIYVCSYWHPNDKEIKAKSRDLLSKLKELFNALTKARVIFDTNILSNVQKLFDFCKKKISKNGFGARVNRILLKSRHHRNFYQKIWNILKKFNVNKFFKRFLKPKDMVQFATAVAVVQRIITGCTFGLDIDHVVPSFVFNEFTTGFTSKTNEPINYQPNISRIAFLYSIPNVKILSIKCPLQEGVDFPPKFAGNHEQNLQQLENFIKKQCEINKRLNDLVEHMRGDDVKIQDRVKDTEKLIQTSNNVLNRCNLYDKIAENVFSVNRRIYSSLSTRISSFVGKIKNFKPIKPKVISFDDAVHNLAERLLKDKEEFDYADLIIYLNAVELNAKVLTLNKQAFQEINDPVFLGYFKNVAIIHPEINYNSFFDLYVPDNCETIMKTAVINFDEMDQFFANQDTIKNKHGDEFESRLIGGAHEKWLQMIQNPAAENDLASKFSWENTVFSSIDLLKNENNNLQIDSARLFDTPRKITAKIDKIHFINEYFFDSQLRSDNFTTPSPFGNSQPAMLKNERLRELVENNTFNENLDQFLSIIDDRAKTKACTDYFMALHIQTIFII